MVRVWRYSAVLGVGVFFAPAPVAAQIHFGEQSYEYELAEVLPGAEEFVRSGSHWRAYGPAGGEGEATAERPLLGFVFLTDDLVEIPAYSGQTINTLVGMDTAGRITGLRIVRHAEPIVLIGLAEEVIHTFVDQYIGLHIADRIMIGAGGPRGLRLDRRHQWRHGDRRGRERDRARGGQAGRTLGRGARGGTGSRRSTVDELRSALLA